MDALYHLGMVHVGWDGESEREDGAIDAFADALDGGGGGGGGDDGAGDDDDEAARLLAKRALRKVAEARGLVAKQLAPPSETALPIGSVLADHAPPAPPGVPS